MTGTIVGRVNQTAHLVSATGRRALSGQGLMSFNFRVGLDFDARSAEDSFRRLLALSDDEETADCRVRLGATSPYYVHVGRVPCDWVIRLSDPEYDDETVVGSHNAWIGVLEARMTVEIVTGEPFLNSVEHVIAPRLCHAEEYALSGIALPRDEAVIKEFLSDGKPISAQPPSTSSGSDGLHFRVPRRTRQDSLRDPDLDDC